MLKAFNKAFNATDSLFNSPVCEVACCFFWSLLALQHYVWTHKEKVDDYRPWNLWSEVQKYTCKTHPLIATGAAKDNKMKIFEITTSRME